MIRINLLKYQQQREETGGQKRMLTDIEIAQQAEMETIKNVAAKIGMSEDEDKRR